MSFVYEMLRTKQDIFRLANVRLIPGSCPSAMQKLLYPMSSYLLSNTLKGYVGIGKMFAEVWIADPGSLCINMMSRQCWCAGTRPGMATEVERIIQK